MTRGFDKGGAIDRKIGALDELVRVPYDIGLNTILAHLNTAYYHVHGKGFCYPDHADSVVLTSANGAWAIPANVTEVIPAGALNEAAFDLHWINISAIDDVAEIQIDIFAGDVGEEVRICPTRSQRNTNQSRESANKIQIPQQPPGTRISCKLSDSTAGNTTAAVSFEGHYYST